MYANSKVYKVCDINETMVYYGSTIQPLCKRMSAHRTKYMSYLDEKYHYVTIFSIFETFGMANCKIYLVEAFECNNKEELHAKEAEYILANECVNKNIPGRTHKQYYNDKRAKILEQKKEYQEANKEVILEYQKQYYEANKDAIAEQMKQNYEANKEARLEKQKTYYEANKEAISLKKKEAYLKKKALKNVVEV